MICPFCNSKMKSLFASYSCCKHKNEMIILELLDQKKIVSICKDGFEIIVGDDYTRLHKYDPLDNPTNIFFYKGFVYDGGNESESIVKVDHKLPISPSNFNYFKNKLLSLIPFS